jgi:hypothetical protein
LFLHNMLFFFTIWIWVSRDDKYLRRLKEFKRTVSRDFRPTAFSLNSTPGWPNSWDKAVLNIGSNSRRNSIRFFLLDTGIAKLKILFNYGWFFIDCFFNDFCKSRKNFFRLCAMRHSDSALCRKAQSCNSAICSIGQSSDSALCAIART